MCRRSCTTIRLMCGCCMSLLAPCMWHPSTWLQYPSVRGTIAQVQFVQRLATQRLCVAMGVWRDIWVQCSAVQCSAVQCSAVQCSILTWTYACLDIWGITGRAFPSIVAHQAFAALSVHSGAVGAHETCIMKTIACGDWSLARCGF
jgi:hypothetical protein